MRRWRVEGETSEVERALNSLSPCGTEKSSEVSCFEEKSTIIYTCYWNNL